MAARAITASLLSLGLVLSTSNAQAWTIGTGFTKGCHERITAKAYEDFLLDLPVRSLIVPLSATWRRVGPFLIEQVDQDPANLTDRQEFLLVSMLVGIRAPDTEGHSILNLDSVRLLHTDPNPVGQYDHALRGLDDDGEDGAVAAVLGTRQVILDNFAEAIKIIQLSPEEQIITTKIFFDFYGEIEIDVWGPGFYVGRAAHALQDSFAHTIRDEHDGFHSIISVFNFSEAIQGTLEVARDGSPHSIAMDECEEATEKTREAAIRATRDLFVAARERIVGRDSNSVEQVLDNWMNYKRGCNAENKFCDNQGWADLAATSETGPVIACSTTGHTSGGQSMRGSFFFGFLVLGGLAIRRRVWRTRLLVAMLALISLGCTREEDVFSESLRDRETATDFSAALQFEGATHVPISIEGAQEDGPLLESFIFPIRLISDRQFEITVVAGSATQADVDAVIIQIKDSTEHLRIPVTVAADGTATIRGQLKSGEVDHTGARFSMNIGLENVSGAIGRQGSGAVTVLEQPDSFDLEMLALVAHRTGVEAVGFPNDAASNVMVTAGEEGLLMLWDLETKRRTLTLDGHSKSEATRVFDVAATSDAEWMVSAGQDGTVRFWDSTTLTEVAARADHGAPVKAIALSPDDATTASGGWDGTVRLWQTRTGVPQQPAVLMIDDRINAVEFSPDGALLAVGTGRLTHPGKVVIYDAVSWNQVAEITTIDGLALDGEVTALAFSPDGNALVAGFGRGGAAMFDTSTWVLIRKLEGAPADTIENLGMPAQLPGVVMGLTLNGRMTFWGPNGEVIGQRRADNQMFAFRLSSDGKRIGLGTAIGTAWVVNVDQLGLSITP